MILIWLTIQTVYAKKSGSIAAPTAGLHFSNELMTSIERNGIDIDYLTLHIGLGTFLPIKQNDIYKHKMHKESFFIRRKLIEKIEKKSYRRGYHIFKSNRVLSTPC